MHVQCARYIRYTTDDIIYDIVRS